MGTPFCCPLLAKSILGLMSVPKILILFRFVKMPVFCAYLSRCFWCTFNEMPQRVEYLQWLGGKSHVQFGTVILISSEILKNETLRRLSTLSVSQNNLGEDRIFFSFWCYVSCATENSLS